MLGRFALTSSLSRRSSRGCPVGSTRFGFCCCETGPLNVFTIAISIHPLFEIQGCRPAAHSPNPGDVPRYLYGSVLAQSHARRARRFFAPARPLPQGKNVASEGGGLIGLCFRGTLSRKL